MCSRLFLAVIAAVSLIAPAGVAAPPASKSGIKPTVVVQAQPVGRILSDLREFIKLATGPMQAEAATKKFQEELKETLGEKGFEGLDLNRQCVAYVTAREVDTDSTIVVVVPITTEKEFLGLLSRLDMKTAAVAGKAGLFTLELPEKDLFPHPSHVRFVDNWAYVGFNGDEVADPANLIPVADLIDLQEPAQIVATFYPNRLPQKLLKAWLAEIDQAITGVKAIFAFAPPQVAKSLNTIYDEGLKLLRRHAESIQKDGKEMVLRYTFDPVIGSQTVELTLSGQPGSDLAKVIAARKPVPHRFAGLIGQDVAVGITGQVPLFAPESREIVAAMFEIGQSEAESLPESVRPVAIELLKGFARTARAGDADLAAALIGPGTGGLFTAVGAVSFDGPGGVEKALRAAVEQDADLKAMIKLDADQASGVSIHTVAVGSVLNEDFQPVFGKDAVLCLGFRKDAIYAAVGPGADAMKAVKGAIAAKPGPAPAAEVVGNFARLTKLVTLADGEKTGKQVAALLGSEDKRVPFMTVTVEGGDHLTIRYTDNVKSFLRAVIAGETLDGPAKARTLKK